VENRLKNIIDEVQNLLLERQELISVNQSLSTEIEALKVAINKQNETTTNNKQLGNDEQIGSEVEEHSAKSGSQYKEVEAKSTLDKAQLKLQIDSALEEIDQCIHIISAK
jgi:hypothetical protein